MPYSLSVWLDDESAQFLNWLCQHETRTRSGMVKVLIKREKERAREKKALKIIQPKAIEKTNET